MRFNNLNDWLAWQESLNPKEIDLGLERVSRVLAQAGLSNTFDCPLITVAGTNGKGSVVAMLEAIAKSAGLKVCSYSSPHIFQYNERIKINGAAVADTDLCEAFERIDQARGDVSLTYFEFGTLATIDLFFREQPDLVILEVGLGGRLDAVNIMDADISVITSVAIDHVDWLGDDRESIGFEKAGVFRQGKPVVCGDQNPPQSVLAEAVKLQCDFLLAGCDFAVSNRGEGGSENWRLKSRYFDITELPLLNLAGEFQKRNATTAIVVLQSLQEERLLATDIDIAVAASSGLRQIELAGRFQQINNRPQVYVDVAHNPQAALALSSQINSLDTGDGKIWAIVAMLADKDVSGVLANLTSYIDNWCFAGLEHVARGMPVQDLYEALDTTVFSAEKAVLAEKNRQDLAQNQCTMLSETVLLAENIENACDLVLSKVEDHDRIIIFGSFYTVSDAMNYFSVLNHNTES